MKRILLVAVLAIGLMGAACGSDDDNASSNASTATTRAAAATTAADNASGKTLSISSNSEYGDFLVGPNGHTLYLFEKDSGTTTACTGQCVANWPALTSSAKPTVASGIDESKVSTANGEAPNQVVYNGHLLYYFAGDTKTGDVNGTKIPAWYPVNPAGDKIDND